MTPDQPLDVAVIGGSYPTLPQRLAGRDLFWWLTRLGLMRVTADSRLGRRIQIPGVVEHGRVVHRRGVTDYQQATAPADAGAARAP